jgi:hypothetical protein
VLSVDLSHIPDEQKSLKVTSSSNDNSMKLETINLQEYFVKLKELRLNDQGDLVMTLKPLRHNLFLEKSREIEHNNMSTNNLTMDTNDISLGSIIEDTKLQKDFVKIDGVISGFFNNLLKS